MKNEQTALSADFPPKLKDLKKNGDGLKDN